MSNEDNNILKYNHGEKSLKVPFIIDADIESLLPKMPCCQNNPEKSYTEKKAKYTPSGYAWCATCSFDATKSKRNFYV